MQIHPSLINPLLKTCKASSYGRFLLIKSLHKVLTQHDKVTALFLDLDTAPIYLNVLCHWWRASPGKLLLQVMPLKPISTRSWSSCLAPERQRERERETQQNHANGLQPKQTHGLMDLCNCPENVNPACGAPLQKRDVCSVPVLCAYRHLSKEMEDRDKVSTPMGSAASHNKDIWTCFSNSDPNAKGRRQY